MDSGDVVVITGVKSKLNGVYNVVYDGKNDLMLKHIKQGECFNFKFGEKNFRLTFLRKTTNGRYFFRRKDECVIGLSAEDIKEYLTRCPEGDVK